MKDTQPEVKPSENTVLNAYGLVEITNADGSKSQITKEEAQRRIDEAKSLETIINQ